MDNKGSQDFNKKGKKLIIWMIVALFLCPVACDRNEVIYLVSGGGNVSLPTHSYWQKKIGDNVKAGDKLYSFYTQDGTDWGVLGITFNNMYVKIKGNKMYDSDGSYVGRIRLTRNGDIVIWDNDISGLNINGKYYQ